MTSNDYKYVERTVAELLALAAANKAKTLAILAEQRS